MLHSHETANVQGYAELLYTYSMHPCGLNYPSQSSLKYYIPMTILCHNLRTIKTTPSNTNLTIL